MDTDLLTNPGFWISITLVAMAWGFGSLLKRAGKRSASKTHADQR